MHESRWTRKLTAVACLLLLFVGAVFAAPSNKWRIQVSSDADSDGAVSFRIAPVDGQPIDVSVPIPKGAGENRIASLIRDAMRAKLGDGYRVEVDDGEDVLVKKHMGDKNFELTITEQTAKGVRITLDRE
ncbi:hypothetical protein IU514_06555 [Lysobacter niastensis]|uniref:PepSY domain-containing protein n=2 Tax=Lysobacter niastensis TaxID=380629 RepID=A0ABS0B4R4_9GAMM|nr:hypothetical protein [Lysobacter niastensis]